MSDKLTSICMEIAFTFELPPKAVYDYAAIVIAQSKDSAKNLSLKDTKKLRMVSDILSKAYAENKLEKQGIRLANIIKTLFVRLRENDLIE